LQFPRKQTLRHTSIRNPWLNLPLSPPYALEADLAQLNSFNASALRKHQFDLRLFPEPFFGTTLTPVVVLNLNPGWSPEDEATHSQPWFADQARRSLAHALEPYPFIHLLPGGRTGGCIWWQRRTRELVDDVGFDRIAKGIACVQYMPYHSPEFSQRVPLVQSQEYSFQLVRNAMRRGAEIVVMRSFQLWVSAIPEITTYAHLHVAVNPRSPYLSPGNLKSSYVKIVERLRRDA